MTEILLENGARKPEGGFFDGSLLVTNIKFNAKQDQYFQGGSDGTVLLYAFG